MSKVKKNRNALIFFAALILAGWSALMGVLVLQYGFEDGVRGCGSLCGERFAIKQYFGQVGYERFTAGVLFVCSLLFVVLAVRQGLFPRKREKEQKRRR